MPEAKDLHIDATLTNMSVQYKNEQMIWPLVMPSVKVGKRSDKITKYNKEDSYKLRGRYHRGRSPCPMRRIGERVRITIP